MFNKRESRLAKAYTPFGCVISRYLYKPKGEDAKDQRAAS